MINLRQNQLQVFKELLQLEQRIICRFLPKSYDETDHDVAPNNLIDITITGHNLTELTNQTKKLAKREKRKRLAHEVERYENMIQDHQCKFQQGLDEIEKCLVHETYNGIPLIDMIQNYFNHKTKETLSEIFDNLLPFRAQIMRRRRRYLAKRVIIDPAPEVIIDAHGVTFNDEQIEYLSRGRNKTILSCIQ